MQPAPGRRAGGRAAEPWLRLDRAVAAAALCSAPMTSGLQAPQWVSAGQKLVAGSCVPILCLLTQEPAGTVGSPGDILLQKYHRLEFAYCQLPVATIAISFAVFKQGAGSVFLREFLHRRVTGQMSKEYVL